MTEINKKRVQGIASNQSEVSYQKQSISFVNSKLNEGSQTTTAR